MRVKRRVSGKKKICIIRGGTEKIQKKVIKGRERARVEAGVEVEVQKLKSQERDQGKTLCQIMTL